jgi:deoxyribodipyrimidine photo-lyase
LSFYAKLESEPAIEYENLHPAFNGFRDQSYASAELQNRLTAWKTGQTGWPLVDACMAMLRDTGWVNFRMRAMLMSTASYLLWLHWRETGLHLAREFVDYEPGIHWPQVQMQSGTTGINTLRIYNPVKQAKDQDPEGVFVRRWLPTLRNVPNTWIFQPWLMPESLQLEYGCRIGIDYPAPLVNIDQAFKLAKAKFSQLRMNSEDREQTAKIIKKHASRKSTSRMPTTKNGKVTRKKPASKPGSRQQSLF